MSKEMGEYCPAGRCAWGPGLQSCMNAMMRGTVSCATQLFSGRCGESLNMKNSILDKKLWLIESGGSLHSFLEQSCWGLFCLMGLLRQHHGCIFSLPLFVWSKWHGVWRRSGVPDMEYAFSSAPFLWMADIKPLIKLSVFKVVMKILTLLIHCVSQVGINWRCPEQTLNDIIILNNW